MIMNCQKKQIIDTGNTGAFYNYINRKLGRQQSIGILENNNGQYVTSDVGKAELLNSYFSSINVQDDGNNPVFHRRVADSISIDTVQFTPAKLLKVTKKLNNKTTADPDGYCNLLLKEIIPAISYAVCIMFQSFTSVGKIPDGWKTAIIIPLYKKGSSSQVSNYRPISLTSLFSKLIKRIISAELLHYLQQNRFITA